MRWLDRLVNRGPVLDAAAAARLERWTQLAEPALDVPPDAARMLVVDVESTGLDVRRDRLLAIGAVALVGGRIDLADSFYRVLRQDTASSRENILVHGIGGTEQTSGDDPIEVLLAFLEYAGKAPLVAFHAGFDEIMIDRAVRHFLRSTAFRQRRWLDLAFLAPALHPGEQHADLHALDDWLGCYGITVYRRHDALADALATAQLLQVLLARAAGQGVGTVAKAFATSADARWLRQYAR
jgi:DNA polymerase-3 subunit epsilon